MSQRAFRCQLCGSGLFRPIVVPRPDGSNYATSFYECAGCSVMFIDPQAFNANEPGPPHSSGAKLAAAPPTMSLDTYGRASAATSMPAAPASSVAPAAARPAEPDARTAAGGGPGITVEPPAPSAKI
jgi:hypothetical protein